MRAKTSDSWWAAAAAPLMLLMGCAAESAPDEPLLEADASEAGDPAGVVARIGRDFRFKAVPILEFEGGPVLRASIAASFESARDGWNVRISDTGAEAERTPSLWVGSSAQSGFEISEQSGISSHVQLIGASEVDGELVDGYVVFPEALDGSHVVHRIAAHGIEDFILFEQAPRERRVRYSFSADTVAGLRLVGNTLELLDEEGSPRLRVAPPYVVDTNGTRRDATIGINGCEVDTDGSPPWGREVTPPGSRFCEMTVAWDDTDLEYPLLLDPSWAAPVSMSLTRDGHAAARLPGPGNLLIVMGGQNSGAPLASTEYFNGTSFAAGPPMFNARALFGHSQTSTGGVDYVLVAGGVGCAFTCSQAERFNTATFSWQLTANNMVSDRVAFPLSLLGDGTGRVLASGGFNSGAVVLNSGDLYNPATNSWTGTANGLTDARYGHRSVGLTAAANSRVIVVGGRGAAGTGLLSTEQFTPVSPGTGTFSSAGSVSHVHYNGTASYLFPDKVFVVGGETAGTCTSRTSMYTASGGSGSWASAASVPLGTNGLCRHAAATLYNGKLLVAGGKPSPGGNPTTNVFIYNNGFNTWTAQPLTPLSLPRESFTMTSFPASPNDKILALGGFTTGGVAVATGAAYTP